MGKDAVVLTASFRAQPAMIDPVAAMSAHSHFFESYTASTTATTVKMERERENALCSSIQWCCEAWSKALNCAMDRTLHWGSSSPHCIWTNRQIASHRISHTTRSICTVLNSSPLGALLSVQWRVQAKFLFITILNQKANSDSTVFGAGAADNGVRNPNIIVGKGQLVPEQLQASTPHSFEVIDTSNLSDSSGLPYLISSVRVLLYWRHTRTGKFPLCFAWLVLFVIWFHFNFSLVFFLFKFYLLFSPFA